jgi:hypothetical protein
MHVQEYSAFATAIDLCAAYPGGGGRKRYATAIEVVTAGGGVLQITTDRGASVTLSALTAGYELPGRFAAIGTATTCALVRVFWD